MEQIQLRLSKEVLQVLDGFARHRGMTRQELIRSAINLQLVREYNLRDDQERIEAFYDASKGISWQPVRIPTTEL